MPDPSTSLTRSNKWLLAHASAAVLRSPAEHLSPGEDHPAPERREHGD